MESDWLATIEAMRKHTPNAWHRFERMPPDGPGHVRMKRMLVDRHRQLQRVEQRDPELFKRELEQLELEDEILGIARQIWGAGPDGNESKDLRNQLRDRVGRLVDLRIQNREARLKRLTETLENETRRLNDDKRDRDAVVERQFDAVLKGRGPIVGRPGRQGEGPPRGPLRRGEGRPGGRERLDGDGPDRRPAPGGRPVLPPLPPLE